MSNMLKEIYADTHSSRATVYMDGSSPVTASTRPFRTGVKYIRADITEARIAKLEDALDVAEEALLWSKPYVGRLIETHYINESLIKIKRAREALKDE
jgi:hypothetical protein